MPKIVAVCEHSEIIWTNVSQILERGQVLFDDEIKKGYYTKALSGGSSAKVHIVYDQSNQPLFVRKVAYDDGVNGNGLPHLFEEIDFYRLVLTDPNYRSVRQYFPELRAIGPNYFDMEFIPGRELSHILRDEKSFNGVSRRLFDFFQTADQFYKSHQKEVDRKGNQALGLVKSLYFEPLEKRMEGLKRTLSAHDSKTTRRLLADFEADTVVVNGQKYENPLKIIDRMQQDPIFMAKLSCDHHTLGYDRDMGSQNVMVPSDESSPLRLVDGKIKPGLTDPYFDIMKFPFSIFYTPIFRNEFDLSINGNEVTCAYHSNPAPIEAEFYDILRNACPRVDQNKLRFLAALQLLRDMPYRLGGVIGEGSPTHESEEAGQAVEIAVRKVMMEYCMATVQINRWIVENSLSNQ